MEIIQSFIKRMDILLKAPEFKLVEQGVIPDPKKDNDMMFFLAKGKCRVVIRDKFEERFEDW